MATSNGRSVSSKIQIEKTNKKAVTINFNFLKQLKNSLECEGLCQLFEL